MKPYLPSNCLLVSLIVLLGFSCTRPLDTPPKEITVTSQHDEDTELIILGNVQDAGSPHTGCQKKCCSETAIGHETRFVASMGLVDHKRQKTYLFDATPDMSKQLRLLQEFSGKDTDLPDGIFLTHAHIGHYTGLMYLGRESVNASNIPVYAMPRMKKFLESNGPWQQLVSLKNISIVGIADKESIKLSNELQVVPIAVPHRDEYSETVGYVIKGPERSVLFIPDIDKWSKWDQDIQSWIKKVDYAFLDATFFDAAEIGHRDMSEIPHPFVVESMALFDSMAADEKAKIHFIHLNHTNSLLNEDSENSRMVLESGYKIARQGTHFSL
jgi:pyrroloquinoline quinone biosynthesis protein B